MCSLLYDIYHKCGWGYGITTIPPPEIGLGIVVKGADAVFTQPTMQCEDLVWESNSWHEKAELQGFPTKFTLTICLMVERMN